MAHPLGDFLEKYKRWGFSIIPIKHKEKEPAIDSWAPYRERKPDNAELGDWFGFDETLKNIGVICGKISGNLVVLDFDSVALFEGFQDFWEVWYGKSLEEMTPVVKTGGRGVHVYLRINKLPRLFHPSGEDRKRMPDVQSEGGYVVAPPSLHPSGNHYEFLNPKCQEIAVIDDLSDVGITAVPYYEEPKPRSEEQLYQPQSEDFNHIAVAKILQHCAFLQHCQRDAAKLSEPHWWSMVHCLSAFGKAGYGKIHELSAPYPKYSQKETDKKIEYAEKTILKGVGPHTCHVIQTELMFSCPENCMARAMEILSPAGMASRLASQELVQQRTRSVNITTTKKGKQEVKVNCPTLAEELMNDYIFKTFRDSEEVIVYQQGVYRYQGESVIKEQVQHRLLHLTSTHRVNEVVDYIKRATYTERSLFNNPSRLLNLKNGLYDTASRALLPHTPDYLSTVRIPVEYKPEAKCPKIQQFLQDILIKEDVPVIEELAGYCLEPGYHIHRAFMFIGDGANGKTTLIELLRSFLGKENCATVSLQALETNRFAPANLFGKLANLYADVPSTILRHVGTFKMLTGADSVQGEKKFKEGFSFYSHAKLIFSTNKPPRVLGEDTYAFWRRWILINFPNQFTGWKADKSLIQKITTPEELAGFLNVVLEALRRLKEAEDFSYASTAEAVADTYIKAADPIHAFITEGCILDPDGWTSKDDLYNTYKEFCQRQKIPIMGKESLGRALKNTPSASDVKSDRRRISGELVHGWKGVKLY